MERRPEPLRPRTIYFGGGTPTSLSVRQLDYLLGGLRARLDLRQLEEFTVEANPATVPTDKAKLLLEAGVTRLSLGVQSWDDEVLRTLGRVHNAEQAKRTFNLLRETGFKNVNLDLMFAVPGQSLAQWEETLRTTVEMQPEHVSSYCLTYEEDTAYFRQLQLGTFVQDEDREVAFFETTMDTLARAGLAQYEISNYARPGCESRHNQAYWSGADYLGFGPSAFSTVGLSRWQNLPDTAEYTRRMHAHEAIVSFTEELPAATRSSEVIAFAMRTRRGVEREELSRWPDELREFQELGFLQEDGSRFVLTRRGKLMADSVARAFL